jgi:hypothetical protein
VAGEEVGEDQGEAGDEDAEGVGVSKRCDVMRQNDMLNEWFKWRAKRRSQNAGVGILAKGMGTPLRVGYLKLMLNYQGHVWIHTCMHIQKHACWRRIID